MKRDIFFTLLASNISILSKFKTAAVAFIAQIYLSLDGLATFNTQ